MCSLVITAVCMMDANDTVSHLYMFVPINNALAGKVYTSKTTMHRLACQNFDGIEWKVATCIERPCTTP